MSSLLAVSLWYSGRVSVSHTGDWGFEYSNTICLKIIFLTEFAEFREFYLGFPRIMMF